jgi:hypothetical protein
MRLQVFERTMEAYEPSYRSIHWGFFDMKKDPIVKR